MSPEAVLVALLHVSAVVGVMTAAYVGFDHSREGRSPNDEAYKASEEIAKKLVLKLGLNNTPNKTAMQSKKWGKVKIIYPTAVICIVAKHKIRLGYFHRAIHLIYRQFHIPFYAFFRNRLDYWAAGIFAVISLGMFFTFASAIVWNIQTFQNITLDKACFFILLGIGCWIVIQGLCSLLSTTKRVNAKCERLDSVVGKRLTKVLSDAEQTIAEFKPETAQQPTAAAVAGNVQIISDVSQLMSSPYSIYGLSKRYGINTRTARDIIQRHGADRAACDAAAKLAQQGMITIPAFPSRPDGG
jgi:hypothetical protein